LIHKTKVGLGFMYLKGLGVQLNYPKAIKWFGNAAEQGDVEAQHYLKLAKELREKYGNKSNN